MGFNSSLKLRIADADPRDIPTGRSRLHPETMSELDVSGGDAIKITHERGTVGSFCSPQESGSSSTVDRKAIRVKLDTLLPGSGTSYTGEVVTVQKISPPNARKVVSKNFLKELILGQLQSSPK